MMLKKAIFTKGTKRRLLGMSACLFIVTGSCATPQMLDRIKGSPQKTTQAEEKPVESPSTTTSSRDQISDLLGGTGEAPAKPSSSPVATAKPLPETALPSGPARYSEADFIGQDISALESVIGQAVLVRAEGVSEFRRYDLQGCKVYAVVTRQSGVAIISSLSAAGVYTTEPTPSVGACIG